MFCQPLKKSPLLKSREGLWLQLVEKGTCKEPIKKLFSWTFFSFLFFILARDKKFQLTTDSTGFCRQEPFAKHDVGKCNQNALLREIGKDFVFELFLFLKKGREKKEEFLKLCPDFKSRDMVATQFLVSFPSAVETIWWPKKCPEEMVSVVWSMYWKIAIKWECCSCSNQVSEYLKEFWDR